MGEPSNPLSPPKPPWYRRRFERMHNYILVIFQLMPPSIMTSTPPCFASIVFVCQALRMEKTYIRRSVFVAILWPP